MHYRIPLCTFVLPGLATPFLLLLALNIHLSLVTQSLARSIPLSAGVADQYVLDSNGESAPSEVRHRETLDEAAGHVKRMIQEVTHGSIGTVFPSASNRSSYTGLDNGDVQETFWGEWRKPGIPFTMLEYHAPCHPLPSLTFLLLPISLSVRNIIGSPTHAVSYMLRDERAEKGKSWSKDRGLMDSARVALVGNMTILNGDSLHAAEDRRLAECYTRYHPDAADWLPDAEDSPHDSVWARFDPQGVYYIGGFGDEHFIGEIPLNRITDVSTMFNL